DQSRLAIAGAHSTVVDAHCHPESMRYHRTKKLPLEAASLELITARKRQKTPWVFLLTEDDSDCRYLRNWWL
ncbi:hypothetical protein PanWU01x14_369160, partial [Parasponia andersonii]